MFNYYVVFNMATLLSWFSLLSQFSFVIDATFCCKIFQLLEAGFDFCKNCEFYCSVNRGNYSKN